MRELHGARTLTASPRSLHWSDLHQMLLRALPQGMVRFSHTVTSVQQQPGSQSVTVRAEKRASKDSDETEALQLECDLLVAADGSMSATRAKIRPEESRRCGHLQHRLQSCTALTRPAFVSTLDDGTTAMLPEEPQPAEACVLNIIIKPPAENCAAHMLHRYSGYCAWRGVVTDSEAPEAAAAVRKAYSEMGKALYFEIAEGTHGVLYELPRQRLNWLWCVSILHRALLPADMPCPPRSWFQGLVHSFAPLLDSAV